MRLRYLFPLLALAAVQAHAADSFVIDAAHTYPVFAVNHHGFTTQHGRFDKTSGQLVLDFGAHTGSGTIHIDTASINMGLEAWNKAMREKFFDVTQYPTATYAFDKLEFEADKPVAADGRLTLLGVTRPLRLSVQRFHCGSSPTTKKFTCGADLAGSLRRSDFGMLRSLPGVGDEIQLVIAVEAYKE
ncbi:MAG: polyisoprenoid-binding protein [Rhodocyclaceae bacterium]|nr:polyisoprenoid-binding protein [Rhodocyclaceae bacterium]